MNSYLCCRRNMSTLSSREKERLPPHVESMKQRSGLNNRWESLGFRPFNTLLFLHWSHPSFSFAIIFEGCSLAVSFLSRAKCCEWSLPCRTRDYNSTPFQGIVDCLLSSRFFYVPDHKGVTPLHIPKFLSFLTRAAGRGVGRSR